MTKGVEEMVRDMAAAFFRVTGVAPTPEQQQAVEMEVRQQFAGERVYVAGQPKRQRAVQLARLNLTRTRDMAEATGISERRVRQLMRGK